MKCLVIEDDTQTAHYICNSLRESGHDITLSQDGQDGLEQAVSGVWDMVILDRMLPGGLDGLTIVERMRALDIVTPVLVTSALSEIDERVRGLRAGGDDYLTKPFAMSELLARVEALARRATTPPERARLQVADLVLDLRAQRVTRAGTVIPLQPRELRLLEYLMRHQGQIVTRSMLLEAVWDARFDAPTNVVNVHISRLRGKIDRDFAPGLIHTVRGDGYRFGDDG
ncbi:MAG: response regulator transcription factor [Gammaproteobacteria bacterium]|nr:response regulator transcription factor [Gammaproteobacteria bacterium]